MYKLNVGYRVNTKASKTGVKWEYRGKLESYSEHIPSWREAIKMDCFVGVKVTDIETQEVVFFETKEDLTMLGKKLKFMREQKGMTQQELAEKSHVNLRSIQNYEQGFKDINGAKVTTVLALAEVLGCDVYDIINPREWSPEWGGE